MDFKPNFAEKTSGQTKRAYYNKQKRAVQKVDCVMQICLDDVHSSG